MRLRHINRRVKNHKDIGCPSCERAKTKNHRVVKHITYKEIREQALHGSQVGKAADC